MTDFARVLASSLVAAPTTFASMRAVAPSPSPAIILARETVTMCRARQNVS